MMHQFHKKNGDDAYKKEAYHNAVFHYNLAIETARSELAAEEECPLLKNQLALLYSNRAAASTMMRHYQDAFEDCNAAIRADPKYHTAHLRKAQLQVILGMLHDAIRTCEKVLEKNPSNSRANQTKKDILAIEKLYAGAEQVLVKLRKGVSISRALIVSALQDVETILKSCVEWSQAKVLKAEALWALGESEEAYELATKLAQYSELQDNLPLHNLCALMYVSMGKSEDAIMNLRMVLANDNHNERALSLFEKLRTFLNAKAQADMAYKSRRFEEALEKYEQVMKICPQESPAYMAKLYFNRACTEASLSRHEQAIHNCNEALRLNEDYIKAYMRRAASLRKLDGNDSQKFKSLGLAIRDYRVALELCKTRVQSREIIKKLKEAKRELALLKHEIRLKRRNSAPLTREQRASEWKPRLSHPILTRRRTESTDTVSSLRSSWSMSTFRSNLSIGSGTVDN